MKIAAPIALALMLSKIAAPIALALMLSPMSISAALADRPANAEERAQIEAVLTAEGFTAWKSVEWDDDGYWEIDDAVAADGREYDLKLDQNLAIIERDPD